MAAASPVTRTDDVFIDSYGVTIHYHRWHRKKAPIGVIQIAHGLGEHAMRYEWLATQLVAEGYEVWANEHRGHGATGVEQWEGDLSKMGRLGPGGLPATIRAIRDFRGLIAQHHPELPTAYLGHSWGSLMGQILLNRGFAADIDAAILTGTTYRMPGYMNPGDLNKRHAHLGETGAEWLSRDTAVHQAFVHDPLTFEADTLKLFGPIDAARLMGTPRAIGADIPLLLMVGSDDSLGGERGVRRLERAYRERGGLRNVRTIVYPDARHEVFNEINREEVTSDLIDWLAQAMGSAKK